MIIYVDSHGDQVESPRNAEISVQILNRRLDQNIYNLSIYLVNEMHFEGPRPAIDDHIFQPQIRILCKEGTGVVKLVSHFMADPDAEEQDFLYRNRPVLARGHICSAVWRDIDPERPSPGGRCYGEAPFGWTDIEVVRDRYGQRCEDFIAPDARTEFVPIFSVESPTFEWHGEHGPEPELDPEILAETWEIDDLRDRLEPLAQGYASWIALQHSMTESMPHGDAIVAQRIIRRCNDVLERIRSGIQFLIDDQDARLSFCFANKAIAVQSQWGGIQNFRWRSFQLAFILMTLESIADPRSPHRGTCDLLWIPTGGGKTEAYLALMAFMVAYRRRRALGRTSGDRTGAGLSVLTRYTLRLLSIQQFRRTLRAVTACEMLRVEGLSGGAEIGWRPATCNVSGDFIWGTSRFSAGLWVGGNVTPNRQRDLLFPGNPVRGAISILKGQSGQGEPAQVLECPACGSILAIPDDGMQGSHDLHLLIRVQSALALQTAEANPGGLSNQSIAVDRVAFLRHGNTNYYTMSITIRNTATITSFEFDGWWNGHASAILNAECVSARPSRMGYFIRSYRTSHGDYEYDFEIFCNSPGCPLHQPWCEGTPSGRICDRLVHGIHCLSPESVTLGHRNVRMIDGNRYAYVQECLRADSPYIAESIPIPAYTVDSQIYHRCPSVLVATVDKVARLPFEPRGSSLFGNVQYHHCVHGYYRQYNPSHDTASMRGHPSPAGQGQNLNYVTVSRLDPPDLIIQDELHLIEGPLGSLAGLYETAVDCLSGTSDCPVKYISSTATVTRAAEQVQSVFMRELQQFPPSGLDIDNRFFVRSSLAHPLEEQRPGRLYAGICAPGRGPLTPVVRIWSRLLQSAFHIASNIGVLADPFWTLTGYFNARRELAGARAIYRQDIPERLRNIGGANAREVPEDRVVELSGNIKSTELPAILDYIKEPFSGTLATPVSADALFTTSMFGTGIDISRLGLMVVHGQPKTTSSYIQSTGRVGRENGALVVTFYRATRPRDLSHYEIFCGYHQLLDRFVEPISVAPFSPGALDRAAGPVATAIIRHLSNVSQPWHREDSAFQMANVRTTANEILQLPDIFERRSGGQPPGRRPPVGSTALFVASELDRWQQIAHRNPANLKYVEYFSAQSPVVLGDPAHAQSNVDIVFENAPQSLRDVEDTTGFQI